MATLRIVVPGFRFCLEHPRLGAVLRGITACVATSIAGGRVGAPILASITGETRCRCTRAAASDHCPDDGRES